MKNKRKKKFEAKEEYVIRNGGILLEKWIVLSQGKDISAGQLKVLSSADMRRLRTFMILISLLAVASIAPSQNPLAPLVNQCLTVVSTAVDMNHDNIIKLFGCCLETFVPIQAMDWVERLKIATDIAYALSYMHNALSKQAMHRNVDSASVHLDYSFHAMLSNIGYSIPITPGDTSQKWLVVGTPCA
ncbi:Wall-associated receptor kinase-like 1 [Bienertia sinuspersici]